jgi:streptomycin 6-kinase
MVTDELVKNVTEAWGQAGAEWLDRLPGLVADIEQEWSVQVSEPFDLSYAYVAPAVRADGPEVVLKLRVPNDEYRREVEALEMYSGRGAVRLLRSDPDRGATLLEHLKPGTPLGDIRDDERAILVATGVMRMLWRPVRGEHSFEEMSTYEGGLEWLQRQLDGSGPLPKPLVVRAEGALRELLEQGNEPVLLHGDLHPWNIISAGREQWLAIDPKGVVGDAAYELGPFIYSLRLPPDQPARVIERRLDQLAEQLRFERVRIMNAILPRAVLAAWPEGAAEVWDRPLAFAELMSELA